MPDHTLPKVAARSCDPDHARRGPSRHARNLKADSYAGIKPEKTLIATSSRPVDPVYRASSVTQSIVTFVTSLIGFCQPESETLRIRLVLIPRPSHRAISWRTHIHVTHDCANLCRLYVRATKSLSHFYEPISFRPGTATLDVDVQCFCTRPSDHLRDWQGLSLMTGYVPIRECKARIDLRRSLFHSPSRKRVTDKARAFFLDFEGFEEHITLSTW